MSIPDPVGYDLFISYSSRDETVEIGGRPILVLREIKAMLEGHRHPTDGRQFRVCTFREDFDLSGDLPTLPVEMLQDEDPERARRVMASMLKMKRRGGRRRRRPSSASS